MMRRVSREYAKRALEYVAALGSVEKMDPLDVALVSGWSESVAGPILDAGSGPGHWTDLLRERGCNISGIDIVQEFVESARERFPLSAFEQGDLLDLPFQDAHFGGVLAWYSMIHMRADMCQQAFEELARILRPDGSLLVGAFLGPQGVPFAHAITEAFYWSEHGLSNMLRSAGFRAITIHTRSSAGDRPHLAVLAQRL